LLSAVTWTGDAGDGNWATPANWSGAAVPTATDDAIIPSGFPTITVSSGTQSVNSLNAASPLTIATGELDIGAGGASLSADITLSGGTIRGGSMSFAVGAELVGTKFGGTLDAVTVTGNIDLSRTDETTIQVEDGLTIDGSILIGSAAGTTIGTLAFIGNVPQTLGAPPGETANVIFGANTYNSLANETDYSYVPQGPGEPLTLASGVHVGGQNGGFGGPGLAGEQIINQGEISSDVSHGSIYVGDPLVNQGTVSATNGATLNLSHVNGNLGTVADLSNGSALILGGSYSVNEPINLSTASQLTLGGSWQNASTITENSSTIVLGGMFTAGDIGTIDRNGGTVEVTGTLDNTGAVLDLNVTGDLALDSGGTIHGGTVDASGAVPLLTGEGGTLDGVTVNGNIEGDLYILNNLVLNGTMDVTGQLMFWGSTAESLTGNATVLLESGGINSEAESLTFGASVTITGGSGGIEAPLGAPVINQGKIIASSPTSAIDIYYVSSFTNDGTLEAINGGLLNVSGLSGDLGTASVSGAGSSLILSGDYTVNSDQTVPDGSKLELDGTWSNTATITVAGGALNLGGNFTAAGMGTITRPDLGTPGAGTINLTGTLDNTDNTLMFDASSGSWNFDGGGIENGTVTESDGAGLLFLAGATGVLDGVTFRGDLDLSQVSGTALGVADGLTLDGHILLGNSTGSTYGELYFTGKTAQTLAVAPGGSATVLFGASNQNAIDNIPFRQFSLSVTFGPGVWIGGQNGVIEEYTGAVTPFINQGTFAIDSGGRFVMMAPLTNQGGVSIGDGGTLAIQNPTTLIPQTTNLGALALSPNSVLSIQGSFSQGASGTLIDQLGGPPTGGFGQIIASGPIALSGALQVDWPAGLDPAPGATIPVINGSSRSGAFATFVTSPPVGAVRVQYTGNSAYLSEGGSSRDVIAGTPQNDTITLSADPDGQTIDWVFGATSGFLPINDPNGLTINGNGGNDTITLDYTNGNPLPNTLHLNGTFTNNNLQGTNPLSGTTLDIGRSTVFISYSSSDPIATIQGYLKNGYNGGTWNGSPTATTGVITSAAAQANANHNTAIGYADSADGQGINTTPNTIELKYTLVGDANLDGSVNTVDLQRLLFAFNTPGAWDQGDFNYDGAVNTVDLQGLLFNFNTSVGNQATPLAIAATPAAAAASNAPSSTGGGSPALLPTIHATGSTRFALGHPHTFKLAARKRR
jgi:hypothetical protein